MQFIGVANCFVSTVSMWAFSKGATKFTTRLRVKWFESVLRQEVGWFDQQSSGTLVSRLAKDVPAVNMLVGTSLATFAQATLMITVCFSTAFYFSWRLSLVLICITPLVAFGAVAMAWAIERGDDKSLGGFISEAVG